MRIISGKHKGKKFEPNKNMSARPTTDFAKEGLFNILSNYIDFENISFLELYAGSGSIGYEMFSRGCNQIVFVDNDMHSIDFIKKTALHFKIPKLQILRADALDYIENNKQKFDLIFADPPYDNDNTENLINYILENKTLNTNGWLIVETSSKDNFFEHPNLINHRKYGQANFWFFA